MNRFLLLAALALAACSPVPAVTSAPATAAPSVTPSPAPSATDAPTATFTPSPTPEPPGAYIAPYLPTGIAAAVTIPEGFRKVDAEDQAAVVFGVTPDGPRAKGSMWIYALVARFPTLPDGISAADLKRAWQEGASETLPFTTLLVDASTRRVLSRAWGPPSHIVIEPPAAGTLDALWKDGSAWAIVPFENLEPRYKVITVDGQSPVRKEFDPAGYPLAIPFGWSALGDEKFAIDTSALPAPEVTNRDPNLLTTVILTGTTSLVRGTAAIMENAGMEYPAEYTGDLLRGADILHISNEMPFDPTCPPPSFWKGFKFCSQTKNIALLEYIGADLLDIAGDHFEDWGTGAETYTISLYEERGWKIVGGGRDLAQAQTPATFEHNGNKLAFLSCNAKEPGYATVSRDHPGALHCDFDWMEAQVKALRAQGYLPIVLIQEIEYWQTAAKPEVIERFARMARAGAEIVSGTGSHQPQTLSFDVPGAEGRAVFQHYGLGNLFFDQKDFTPEVNDNMIDRHVIYAGRHISTELFTTRYVDLAQSRFMEPDERAAFLEMIFGLSGWK